ncbi:MAG TPA: hypothetical protein VJL08_05030 [Dehalococcoidia bacterium]|nr:hypothetical protein [Dehalococcoidia bacterium]
MPQLGDILAKLGQGQTLTAGEIDELRLGMNRLQTLMSLASIMVPSPGAVSIPLSAAGVTIDNRGITLQTPQTEPNIGSSDSVSFLDRTGNMALDLYSWRNDYGSEVVGLLKTTHKQSSTIATTRLVAVTAVLGSARYANIYVVSDDSASKTYAYTDCPMGVGAAPGTSVALDVPSTTRAFRPPVMTSTQRDAIASPANGMIIWNSTTTQLEDYNGGWAAV